MDNITYKDFQKLDIRIGQIKEAVVPEWSHWVMKLKVNFGLEIGERTIFAGIMHFYKPEELVNQKLPFVINIEPKKIGPQGDFSQGMMLAADAALTEPITVEGEQVNDKPVLFKLSEDVEPGTKVL
jgi:methionine--tRNA ligase beta chain